MNSLRNSQVQQELRRLHEASRQDPRRRAARPPGGESGLIRMGEMYLAVSPDEGERLYLLARAGRGRRLVEFGASFGISTLYLAAAARDLGGRLISTEVHPDKCAATRQSLARVGLDGVAEVIEGDARETLREVEGPIDFIFLDGWKSQYLPVLQLLMPRLAEGALVVADNIDHEAARDYADHVRSSTRFVSQDLGKQEVSCHIGQDA